MDGARPIVRRIAMLLAVETVALGVVAVGLLAAAGYVFMEGLRHTRSFDRLSLGFVLSAMVGVAFALGTGAVVERQRRALLRSQRGAAAIALSRQLAVALVLLFIADWNFDNTGPWWAVFAAIPCVCVIGLAVVLLLERKAQGRRAV